MRHFLLALALTVAAAPAAGAVRGALDVLDDCLRQLEAHPETGGYTEIAKRCPELAPSLAASRWGPSLPADWNLPDSALSAQGLEELRTLITRAPPTTGVRAPKVAALAPVLAALDSAAPVRPGWWTRFKQWLRAVLEGNFAHDTGPSWWRRLLSGLDLPQAVAAVLAWGALVVLVIVAAAIIVNELRVAGLLRAGRARGRVRGPATGSEGASLTLEALESAEPAEQPRLLLELIVARLRAQERLPPARALTVHELVRAAQLPLQRDRERLHVLATACEYVRFAGRALAPRARQTALAGGRELLATLETAAPQPAGTA